MALKLRYRKCSQQNSCKQTWSWKQLYQFDLPNTL